ncbi:hypothetical protein RFI_06927 [Reticulomyxa filosa]|uniref:Uncharacterized protein n=1 Tax=Reticulomyxa filosa TaxID=46433 RepID=X6NWD3_RETFI|nr:hypothetical protein RFI_06927 [Reticulomyxa filosa]|eukprot:ETO30193.1 hypothetical protein RFI_06927 [Reticulomyxa filosa]
MPIREKRNERKQKIGENTSNAQNGNAAKEEISDTVLRTKLYGNAQGKVTLKEEERERERISAMAKLPFRECIEAYTLRTSKDKGNSNNNNNNNNNNSNSNNNNNSNSNNSSNIKADIKKDTITSTPMAVQPQTNETTVSHVTVWKQKELSSPSVTAGTPDTTDAKEERPPVSHVESTSPFKMS